MHNRFAVTVLAAIVFGLFGIALNAGAQTRASKWQSSRVTLAVSNSLDAAPNVQGNVREVLEKSIAVWQKAGDLAVTVAPSEVQNVSEKGRRGDGVSLLTAASTAENLRLFPKHADSPAAITRVFADARGNIVEADIALNPYVRFSTDGSYGSFDLQDTLTHEIGHVLGLRHSPVWGSIMYDKGATSFGPGSYGGSINVLPELDAARVRSLYGPPMDEFICCGYVSGRIEGLRPETKDLETIVWIEDLETGRLLAATLPDRDGSYRIAGLREGKYRVLVRSADGNGRIATSEGAVEVQLTDGAKLDLSLEYGELPFKIDLIGNTPLLGRQAARILSGRPHRLYLGGSGAHSQILRIYRSGNAAEISGIGLLSGSSPGSVKMISFELTPSGESPAAGNYTLVIEYANGVRDFLVGALSLSNGEIPVFSSVRE